MEWSLVLASQGIEPIIEQTEEAGWALVVAAHDYEASLAAIRQYRIDAMANAGRVLNEPRYVEAAVRAADFPA